MDAIDVTGKSSRIAISYEELLIINSALNEICNGISVFEFDTRVGASHERVTAFLKEIGSLLDKMDSIAGISIMDLNEK